MKAFLISDIHLGVHQINIDKFLNVAKDYFENFFFPLVEDNYEDGDKVFFLGDIFDNRTAIDIKALCFCKSIFDWLESKNIETHVLIGNHDMWNEASYEFHSLIFLEKYKNVKLYTQPTKIQVGSKNILMMPYIKSMTEEKTVLETYKGKVDFLFCHSDLAGAKNNINSGALTHGLSIADFIFYPHVYSGHIHLRQNIKNFTFIGCPYHLDRNDRGNKKGIYIINLETSEPTFHENNVSPEYKTVELYNESDIEKLDRVLKIDEIISDKKISDWYDLIINNSILMEKPEIQKKLLLATKKNTFLTIKQIDDIKLKKVEDESVSIDNIGNIPDLVRDYVSGQNFTDENVKNEILSILEDTIKICINNKN